MKNKSITLAVLSVLSSPVYAGNFEGFSVFAKAGPQSTNTDLKFNYDDGDTIKMDGSGRSRIVGGIGADYGFKLNEKFLTLVGAEANIGNSNTYKENFQSGPDSTSLSIKQKNTYGVYIAPGYLINESALIYAKFSYNRTKLNGSLKETDGGTATNDKLSANFGGFGFGVGARMLVTNNLFINAEWQKIAFSSESKMAENIRIGMKPETTVGTVAIGFNF